MSKLKPCPFCGRKAELHYYEIDEPFTFTECGYEIYCCHCGIRFKERLNRIPQFDEKADIKKQNLIERWNRRVNDGVESNEADRLIKESDVLKAIDKRIKELSKHPEADRPQGEWIWSPRDTDGTVSGCCSNCSFSHLFIGGHTAQYNYCPSCGARMKGADDERPQTMLL